MKINSIFRYPQELIYQEFFSQGDSEKQLGNTPAEMMDREKAYIPKLQIGFLDGIALPLFRSVGDDLCVRLKELRRVHRLAFNF